MCQIIWKLALFQWRIWIALFHSSSTGHQASFTCCTAHIPVGLTGSSISLDSRLIHTTGWTEEWYRYLNIIIHYDTADKINKITFQLLQWSIIYRGKNNDLVSCLVIILNIRKEIKFTYRAGWTWLSWECDLVVQVSG